MKWRDFLDWAMTDLSVIERGTDKQALQHMRDAQENLKQAIDALGEEVEG